MKKLRLALLGRDVSLSDSEKIHRFILGKMGTECDYEKVSVPETAFCRAAERRLNETDGFNVTIPYKRSIFPYLKSIKGDAAAYGSVNTVVSAEKAGYNTDGKGFLLMLEGAGITVRGKSVLVLGAGGAGRSTAAALKAAGARVFLYRRNRRLLKEACEELGVEAAESVVPCDIFINCTGVGMHESTGQSPVAGEELNQCLTAVDLIYRPAESEFLRLARERGKKTLSGGAMLFYQAYFSDCLYLGRKESAEEAKALYAEYLQRMQ